MHGESIVHHQHVDNDKYIAVPTVVTIFRPSIRSLSHYSGERNQLFNSCAGPDLAGAHSAPSKATSRPAANLDGSVRAANPGNDAGVTRHYSMLRTTLEPGHGLLRAVEAGGDPISWPPSV